MKRKKMAKLVDADFLITFAYNAYKSGEYSIGEYATIGELVTKAPAVDAKPIKRASWKENEEQKHVEICYHCTNCGFGAWGEYERTKYCGGCGAEMENSKDE